MKKYQDQNFDETIAGQSAIRKALLAEADDALSELPGARASGRTLTLPIITKPEVIIAKPVQAAKPEQPTCHNPLAADANWKSERKRRRVTRSRRAARCRGGMRLKFL